MRFTPILLAALAATPAAAADPTPASQARAVFQTYCHRCHGKDGAVEGAMNYVLDLDKLVARKKVTPGDPEKSRLLRRMADGTMPPPGEQPRPSAAELAAVRGWIGAGGVSDVRRDAGKSLTPAETQSLTLADLEGFDRRARRFQRYFTL